MSDIESSALGRLSSPESCLATWHAERAVYATFCEYLRAADVMDCERAGGCFTEDAEVTYHMSGEPMVFCGRRAFVAYLEDAKLVHEMSVHVVGQHSFSWNDGTPCVAAYVSAWHWFLDNAHLGDMRAADFMTVGFAQDEFVLAEGKWLVSRRLVKPAAGLVAVGDRPPVNIVKIQATAG